MRPLSQEHKTFGVGGEDAERNCFLAVVESPELGACKDSASEQSLLGWSRQWKP